MRVVLADNSPAALAAFTSVLQNTCDIIALANDGPSALEALRETRPDVAVLDLEMPGLNGIEISRIAIQEQPSLHIIICSINVDTAIIRAAADAGSRGYVSKLKMFGDLAKAVSIVNEGGTFFPGLEPMPSAAACRFSSKDPESIQR